MKLRTGHRLATATGTWNFFGSQDESVGKSDAACVPKTGTVEAGAAWPTTMRSIGSAADTVETWRR